MQPAVPSAPSTPPRGVRPGDLLVLAGALLVFGFSFAPFVRYGDRAQDELFVAAELISPRFSAWSLETFMVPLTTFVVIASLLAAAGVGIRYWLRRDPAVLGFRLRQIEVGAALFGFLVLLGMVASDKHVFVGARRFAQVDPSLDLEEVALDTSWGAVLMLVGATLAVAGALLNHFSVGPVFAVGHGPTAAPGGTWPATPAHQWQVPPGQTSPGQAPPYQGQAPPHPGQAPPHHTPAPQAPPHQPPPHPGQAPPPAS